MERTKSVSDIIELYEPHFNPKNDITCPEAKEIMRASSTPMEMVGKGYLYGFVRGSQSNKNTVMVPVIEIRMMSDEQWNELAKRNAAERMAITA